jgi:cell division septum initiation protein DivIVA
LQKAAAQRQNDLKTAASTAYKETELKVNDIVSKLESSGNSVTDLSSYKTLVERLKQELRPGVHSPDVAKGYQKILDQITVKGRADVAPVTLQPIPEGGVVTTRGPTKPSATPSFQAIDDARRMLGEAFRGEADEGYKAIGNTAQKEFYRLVSQVQKDFAGEQQVKLLTQYADSRPGLEIFGSKAGTKLTGLDKGALSQFASDPANIPKVFFSTPKMFASLVELVGDKALATQAAQQYTANELTLRKTSREVGNWMTKNREFLSTVPEIKTSVIAYQNSLQNSEREIANIGSKIQKLGGESKATASTANAAAKQMLAEGRTTSQTLTKEATTVSSESAALADKLWNGRSGELKNAREAIEGGDLSRWAAIAPVIERSPEAKTAIFNAVRQVTSEIANNKAVIQKFNEQMRPALERFGMLSKEEADRIASELVKIGAKSGSEAEKLGLMRRLILQGVSGYSSSLTSRGTNYAFISAVDQIPTSSGALGGPIAPPPPKKEGMLSR